jgi:non-ribosomal peptide synthetase component F
MSIIVKEVAELYSAHVENRQAILPPLPIQYADYAIWQRNYLQGEVLDKKMDYWKQKLSGVAALRLPTDHQRPSVGSTRGASKGFSLDKALSSQLQALSQQQGTTLFMTLLAAFKVLLHRYSGQQDICVGSPIANRTQQEVEGLIGFFVNTLALRSDVEGDALFIDLLQQVRATTIEAYEHQEVPFEKVVEIVVKERDLSRNPLFQVMFALQNTPEVPQLRLGEIILSPKKLPHNTTKFDITFLLVETPQGLRGDMQYATDLYDESTITRMLGHFKELLGSIVRSPQQKIAELTMLTKAEEQQLLVEFNDTVVYYPKDKTIIDLFEEQVASTPNNLAVVFKEDQLTYQQLNKQANQLAHYLKSRGVKQDTLVPICIERSLEMITAILGILKAGGAYVPIDPEYPEERISYMLEDTGASIIVSSKESRLKLPNTDIEIIEIDSDWSRLNGQLPTTNYQLSTLTPHNLAYVLYTSGSTGKPKGVMMRGGGLVNLLSWQEKQFVNKNRRVLQFASLNFDVSFQEIFSTLCFARYNKSIAFVNACSIKFYSLIIYLKVQIQQTLFLHYI